ncbi:hypothetical protein [Synechococcus sp. M16CYN]|uniref:hypothetical protein n=1 Tax=Synechococcus sp. M16CYN TaxID=3103139 RepID=UPI00334294C8
MHKGISETKKRAPFSAGGFLCRVQTQKQFDFTRHYGHWPPTWQDVAWDTVDS